MPDKFTVGLIQRKCSLDPRENLATAIAGIREAAARGAQIICLQELFRSQYFCREENHDRFDLAESIPGPSTEALGKLAAELRVVIVASLFERRAAGLYHNTAAVLDADGSLLGIYRKMHIPDDPLYYEKFYFTPGDLGVPSFDTRYGRIAVLVCWDQWYPEAARLASLRGANILFYPTAIGWHPSEKREFGAAQLDAWRTIQRSHAIANGIFVAAVNRVGFEGPPESGIEFWGSSFVADPFGQVIAQAATGAEETLIVECDPRPHRRSAPKLAVSARPPHRRLRPTARTMARLTRASRNPSTPYRLGYRMPAEWEPHEATWLAWPHERTDWPGKFAPIPWVYADIVRQLSRVERVRILIGSAREEQGARRILEKSGADMSAVEFFRVPTNRGWTRDFGPIFVKKSAARNSGVALTNWHFNAWAKYDDWKKDDAATARLVPKLSLPVWEPEFRGRRMVLEGGSIEVNGLRHLADHRGVPAQFGAMPQSGHEPRGSRNHASRLPWRYARTLARKRHRRR